MVCGSRASATLVVMGRRWVSVDSVSSAEYLQGDVSEHEGPRRSTLEFCPVAPSSSHSRPSMSPTYSREAPPVSVSTVGAVGAVLSTQLWVNSCSHCHSFWPVAASMAKTSMPNVGAPYAPELLEATKTA